MSFRHKVNSHKILHRLAKYHRDMIAEKLDSGNLDGIALDGISGVSPWRFMRKR